MIHKFSTKPISDCGIYEQVLIDGQKVSCCGYTLTHNAGEVPYVSLQLNVSSEIKENPVVVQIENKEEIARLMDEKEFVEFCDIWKEVHHD